MVALAAVMFVALLFGLHRWAVPTMAESVAERLPRMAEQAAASQVMSLLERAAFGPSKLPAARQQQLRAAFAELVADLPRAADYRLEFRDGGGLGANALALPDGRIVMTTPWSNAPRATTGWSRCWPTRPDTTNSGTACALRCRTRHCWW